MSTAESWFYQEMMATMTTTGTTLYYMQFTYNQATKAFLFTKLCSHIGLLVIKVLLLMHYISLATSKPNLVHTYLDKHAEQTHTYTQHAGQRQDTTWILVETRPRL